MCTLQNTYEETLVNSANQKSGLNEAVLGSSGAGEDPEKNAARIARLLREGAHSLLDERAANAASDAFQEQVPLPPCPMAGIWLCLPQEMQVLGRACSGSDCDEIGLAAQATWLACLDSH